jgi:hypothetical protein
VAVLRTIDGKASGLSARLKVRQWTQVLINQSLLPAEATASRSSRSCT